MGPVEVLVLTVEKGTVPLDPTSFLVVVGRSAVGGGSPVDPTTQGRLESVEGEL